MNVTASALTTPCHQRTTEEQAINQLLAHECHEAPAGGQWRNTPLSQYENRQLVLRTQEASQQHAQSTHQLTHSLTIAPLHRIWGGAWAGPCPSVPLPESQITHHHSHIKRQRIRCETLSQHRAEVVIYANGARESDVFPVRRLSLSFASSPPVRR